MYFANDIFYLNYKISRPDSFLQTRLAMSFLSTCPYILLLILFVRGMMLDGALDGVLYFVLPDMRYVASSQVELPFLLRKQAW